MKSVVLLFLVYLCVDYAHSSSWKDISENCDLAKEINDAGDKLMVVEFYTTWCAYSESIASDLNASALKYPEVVLLKVDSGKCRRLKGKYKVRASPTFVYLRNGYKLTKFSDANVSRFESVLSQYMDEKSSSNIFSS